MIIIKKSSQIRATVLPRTTCQIPSRLRSHSSSGHLGLDQKELLAPLRLPLSIFSGFTRGLRKTSAIQKGLFKSSYLYFSRHGHLHNPIPSPCGTRSPRASRRAVTHTGPPAGPGPMDSGPQAGHTGAARPAEGPQSPRRAAGSRTARRRRSSSRPRHPDPRSLRGSPSRLSPSIISCGAAALSAAISLLLPPPLPETASAAAAANQSRPLPPRRAQSPAAGAPRRRSSAPPTAPRARALAAPRGFLGVVVLCRSGGRWSGLALSPLVPRAGRCFPPRPSAYKPLGGTPIALRKGLLPAAFRPRSRSAALPRGARGTACGGSGGEGEAGGSNEHPGPGAVLPPPALASHWLLSVPLSQRLCSLAAVAAKSRLPFPRALRLWRPALRSRGRGCGCDRDRTVRPVPSRPGAGRWPRGARRHFGWEGGNATLADSKLRTTFQVTPKRLISKPAERGRGCWLGAQQLWQKGMGWRCPIGHTCPAGASELEGSQKDQRIQLFSE